MDENTKPLSKYYRQPAIYIKFPSGGKYYPPHVVATTETNEHAVLPMTAKDELAFKTPDAMMSGQATVDVIQSCIPDIKDAWQLVNYDIDTILIAIRIASYGESMDVTTTVPKINEQVTHNLKLPDILAMVSQQAITDIAHLASGMKVKVKPLTYRQITMSQLKTFEQQRRYIQIQQNTSMTDEEKTKMFNDSFNALNQLNTDMLLSNIESITLPDGVVVDDQTQIKEFVENAESKLIKDLENSLVKVRQQGTMKPVRVQSNEEQIKNGAPTNYEVPITFDNANFFV